MANFTDKLKETLDNEFNVSVTENGALGFSTTGKNLLDLHFALSSLRNRTAEEVCARFAKAFYGNKLLAVKWLFYACDVRGGLGERRLFRLCMTFLAKSEPEIAKAFLPLIPEYTRWDNLLCLLDTELRPAVVELIRTALDADTNAMKGGKPVSLCAKWMPSINATSENTRRYAKILADGLKMTAGQYRRTLASLRKYLAVTEVAMSSGRWQKIDYEKVPSKANLLYRFAFLNHDETRRNKYLKKLQKGEAKINAEVLFPHDIVHSYMLGGYSFSTRKVDPTIEALWKALPDFVNGDDSTICVADGSGSMYASVSRTKVTALEVANSLAIYFAEHCRGQFKDTYITFSENPQLVDFSHCKTLHDKLGVALSHNEVANTDIEAVFDLILTTAVKAKMKQADLPKNILIISDMEFDYAQENALDKRLFEVIAEKYAAHGYLLPRLIFWNVCSRTGTIPVRENELGVALVSGFSPMAVRMVLSNKLDPFDALLEQLSAERYDAVQKAVEKILK